MVSPAVADQTDPLLRLSGVNKQSGGIGAVGNVFFNIVSSVAGGLLGLRGAGKITFFDLLSRVEAAG